VIADPDFGGRPKVEATRLLKQTKGPPEKLVREESLATAFSKFYFPALPYTAEEGKAIGALLPGATLLTKRRASKEDLGNRLTTQAGCLNRLRRTGRVLRILCCEQGWRWPEPTNRRWEATGF